MKKEAVVISTEKLVSQNICLNLKAIFGELIHFHALSLNDIADKKIACNVCAFPLEDNLSLIAGKVMPGAKFIPVKHTLSKTGFDKLQELPFGKEVLFVGKSKDLVEETINLVLELGANHIAYFPYDQQDEATALNFDTAITTNEVHLVPFHIKKIINLGDLIIDSETVFSIISILNLINKNTRNMLFNYMKVVANRPSGFFNYINAAYGGERFLAEIVQGSDYVIFGCDKDNVIVYQSGVRSDIAPSFIYGHKIHEYFNDNMLLSEDLIEYKVIIFKNKKLIVNKLPLDVGPEKESAFAIIGYDYFNKIVIKQQKSDKEKKVAKYNFDDIIGSSESIQKTKRLALQAASTDLDILIEGESGTGKELFASAIHNESSRKKGPFIAFNCAALSYNLLESELFGYESGAFTGAAKHGKKGLIESASGGTLFLDEIGDLPKEIQVKLLRVLQEREVTRVGSVERVPVDIRIIAATNKDLYDMVNNLKFRSDLYYRLYVLPIRIPPLRERKEDILQLVIEFVKNKRTKPDIPLSTIDFFSKYYWPGNIRELKNCCDYIVNMNMEFNIESLPQNIIRSVQETYESHALIEHPRKESPEDAKKQALEKINEATINGVSIGRKSLTKFLNDTNIFLTEGEVRTLLNELKNEGFILTRKGRLGARITDKGINYLRSDT